MPRSQYLGELELTILLALDGLAAPSSGMAVYDQIVTTTGREISAPTVYITLARLQKKGHVKVTAAPVSAAGGRTLRRYALTAAGSRALGESSRMLRAMLALRKKTV